MRSICLLLILFSMELFAKEVSKQQILDRTRAGIAAITCDSNQKLRKCLKSDDQFLCGQFISDAFSRCVGKGEGTIKLSYPTQEDAKKDMFSIVACTMGHFGIVAKENQKWDKKCEIKVPPDMQIHE